MKTRSLLIGAAFAAVVSIKPAQASERHFAYSYETGVLNPGDIEIEPWSTVRMGRENYYSRWDQRLEFELGVAQNLQTALYWNFKAVTADSLDDAGVEVRESEFEFSGISNEWKLKLSDPVADALGVGLYWEGTAEPAALGTELKLLLDKQMGKFIVASNLIGEMEWEFEGPDETKKEMELALTLSAGYFLTDNLVAGVELRNLNEFEDAEELESSTLSLGPVVAVHGAEWWMALTFLPQLTALKGATGDRSVDLEHRERFETRLLFGFHL